MSCHVSLSANCHFYALLTSLIQETVGSCPQVSRPTFVMLQAHEIPFKIVGEQLHHGPIAGLSVCAWKPLFMTCGQLDRTVSVWNYETGTQELMKRYQDELFSAAIHPTGTTPSKTNTHRTTVVTAWTTRCSSHNPALTVLPRCLPLHRPVCCDRLL